LGLAPPSPRISPWIGAALLVLMSSGLAAGLQGMHSASAVTVDRLPSAGIIGQEPLPETSVILPAGPSDATFPDPASTTSAFPEPPVDIDPARSTPLAAADNAAPVVFKNGVWLYIADADGSNMKLLTDLPDYPYQGSPSWSQDGKLIAFDVQKPQNGEQDKDARIVVVNADGTNPRVFGDGAMPSFSPGGKRLAISRYSPNPGVWVMSAEKPGEEPVLLDDRGWGTDWSPDGRSILYTVTTGNGANFVVFDLVEGERRLVFPEDNLPYRTLFWNFSWSPDSKRIAFRGEKADGKSETGIVDARGSKHGLTTRLTDSTWNWVAWSPDGARILTTRNEPGRKFPQIFSFKPDGNEPLEWLRGQTDEAANVSAAWSPDGKKLALCSRQQPPLRKPFPDQGAR
jgi:dipeptidyl aminopeptidase/acylaminoacyl peptidase